MQILFSGISNLPPDSFKLVNASSILLAKAHGPILLAIEFVIDDDLADSKMQENCCSQF